MERLLPPRHRVPIVGAEGEDEHDSRWAGLPSLASFLGHPRTTPPLCASRTSDRRCRERGAPGGRPVGCSELTSITTTSTMMGHPRALLHHRGSDTKGSPISSKYSITMAR
jgi:hypothetical protein